MQQRKQVDQLAPGDRFSVSLALSAEVISIEASPAGAQLRIKPVPCGPDCNKACSCGFHMLSACDSYPLQLSSRQRVAFLGNLSTLLAESERIRAQIENLKTVRPVDSNPK